MVAKTVSVVDESGGAATPTVFAVAKTFVGAANWVVEGQSASLADLPDWGVYGIGIYQIEPRQSVLGRVVGGWARGGTFQNIHRFSNRHHRQRRNGRRR